MGLPKLLIKMSRKNQQFLQYFRHRIEVRLAKSCNSELHPEEWEGNIIHKMRYLHRTYNCGFTQSSFSVSKVVNNVSI